LHEILAEVEQLPFKPAGELTAILDRPEPVRPSFDDHAGSSVPPT
jgi:hypothetical protein